MSKIQKFLLAAGAFAAVAFMSAGHWVFGFAMLWLVQVVLSPRSNVFAVNVLGTLATAKIVQEALALVFAKRPILNNISKGFTDKSGSPIASYGQPVITRVLGLPTVGNAGDAASATADVDVSVTLNNYKQLRYDFTSVEVSSTDRDLIREVAQPMATALANFMVDAIAALWIPANYPARTGADAVANGATVAKTVKGAGWDYTHLTQVRTKLNKAGVPDYKRFYVGNSDVYGSMLTDARIVAYLNNQSNGDAIKTGNLPDVAGLSLAEYPNLTAITNAAAAGSNVVGFAGTPDSTVYAQRVPRDPRDVIPGIAIPGNVGIVTEPKTGLSVMVVEYVDLSTLAVTTKLLWMYGVAVGNPNNGEIIASA